MKLALTGFAVVIMAVMPARAELSFHFDDEFSQAEQHKLIDWVEAVSDGVQSLVGPFPFDVQIRFVRVDYGEPVPWANTLRGATQGVRFHVDPTHPLETFLLDWTAAHELSHLVVPYLGREHSWFAEGFASYMQYQVMQSMGVISAEEADDRYRQKIAKAASEYEYDDRSVVDAAPQLRAERKYPVMYWGGAVFFLQLDRALGARGDDGLVELVAEYLRCCRTSRDSLEGLVNDLDALIGEALVAQRLEAFRNTRGFPDYDPD